MLESLKSIFGLTCIQEPENGSDFVKTVPLRKDFLMNNWVFQTLILRLTDHFKPLVLTLWALFQLLNKETDTSWYTDHYFKWVEIFAVKEISSETVAKY